MENYINKKICIGQKFPIWLIILSLVLSAIGDRYKLNKSNLNFLGIIIFIFLSLPYLRSYASINIKIIKISNLKFYLLFLYWIFIVFIFYNIDITSLNRFFVFIVYLVIYILYLIQLKNIYTILYDYSIITNSIIFYLLIANILNYHIGIDLNYVMFERYKGIGGPNFHGIISAIGFMSSLTMFFVTKKANKIIYFLFMFISLFNVYITGSRASWLVCIFYILSYSNLKAIINRKNTLYIIFLFIFISISIAIIKTLDINKLRLLFRFDDYSYYGRLNPIFNGINILKNNHFMPYGLGKNNMFDVLKGTPLDNSYLTISLETGIIGSGLLLVFIFKIFLNAINLIRKMSLILSKNNLPLTNMDIEFFISSFSIMLSLLLHGVFESYIFVGLQLGSLILFFCFAVITLTKYKIDGWPYE